MAVRAPSLALLGTPPRPAALLACGHLDTRDRTEIRPRGRHQQSGPGAFCQPAESTIGLARLTAVVEGVQLTEHRMATRKSCARRCRACPVSMARMLGVNAAPTWR
jgi:hypothetical protein